jgi:hypothetical protein
MRSRIAGVALALASLAGPVVANGFSIMGDGGAIPDYPVPGQQGPWNTAPVWPVFSSQIIVPNNVVALTSIQLLGLSHTFRGDVHVFLADPNGVRHNLIVRPGYGDNPNGAGDDGDFLLGDYTIVEFGGASLNQGSTDLNPGTYDEFFNQGPGAWSSPAYPIDDAALSAISGPAGMWTLTIVDWRNGDTGTIAHWVMNGVDEGGLVTPFCFGDGSGAACPCGNSGAAGHGCENSAATGGAQLTSTGTPKISGDTLVLTSAGERPTSLSVVLQGDMEISPAIFGDGRRCAGGSLKRLYVKSASGGTVVAPAAGDPSISARSAALGDTLVPGSTRRIQVYYRDPDPNFCPGPIGGTFNVSNGLRVIWGT